jgi:hypothetical protein
MRFFDKALTPLHLWVIAKLSGKCPKQYETNLIVELLFGGRSLQGGCGISQGSPKFATGQVGKTLLCDEGTRI